MNALPAPLCTWRETCTLIITSVKNGCSKCARCALWSSVYGSAGLWLLPTVWWLFGGAARQAPSCVDLWGEEEVWLLVGAPRLRCIASLSTFHSKCVIYSLPWPAFLRENQEQYVLIWRRTLSPIQTTITNKKPKTPYQNKVLYCRNTSFHGEGRTIAQ